ncbi:lipase maturation factor family protein [Agrococcus terreus]|uniref:Membrane protein n=1 Tax=Agrococcus terreus TaxID=574649 RepID=A0ABQ2KCW4_9MICO|nr:lipase maturation factor family protein [Agrococcus terreus]GGN77858.1 membrane protein [Agrococcus terreus]
MEWLTWLDAPHAELARQVLQRGTALIFAVAFLSTLLQFPALAGERGLSPAPRFIAAGGLDSLPSLFRIRYSDRLLRTLCLICIAIALALVAGLPQAGPPWLPMLAFLILWAVYLSILPIGQTFWGYGWELLLVEAGFTVAFLGSHEVAPPIPILLLVCWLVFRLELGAGLIKIRGGREWRDLTALAFHHETQPMPGPLSRRAHLLPRWFHKGEVLGNHVAQLGAPWLLFLPQPIASIGAAVIIATQGWLVLTGNFAWLNWLTIALAFAAVDDRVVAWLVPAWDASHDYAPTPAWFQVVVLAVAVLVVALSIPAARNLLSRRQLMNASFNRFRIANAYGAFGTVTKRRDEVIVEGTESEAPDAGWQEYGFRGKPGDPARRPPWLAPHHERLGWQLWFLALGARGPWFPVLLERLLEADPATLRLLAHDPFDGQPPHWIRARTFRYRFATHEERRRTGLTWIREEVGTLVAPIRRRT